MVDPDVALVVVDGIGWKRGVVVGEDASRHIWRGQRPQNAFDERGDGRIVEGDNAVGVNLPRDRIADGDRCRAFNGFIRRVRGQERVASVGHGKGACTCLVCSGYCGLHDCVHDLPVAFKVAKEEGVILPYGPAKGTTELVADQRGLLRLAGKWVVGWRKRADRVEDCVADVIVGLAVNLVGSTADADIDDSAGGTAILGGVVVGLDAELADGVRRRGNGLVGKSLVRCAVGIVVDAVEQKIVELTAFAVHIERGIAAGISTVFQ
jgi:hypothetical protein